MNNLTYDFDSDRSINADNTVRVAKITEANQNYKQQETNGQIWQLNFVIML